MEDTEKATRKKKPILKLTEVDQGGIGPLDSESLMTIARMSIEFLPMLVVMESSWFCKFAWKSGGNWTCCRRPLCRWT